MEIKVGDQVKVTIGNGGEAKGIVSKVTELSYSVEGTNDFFYDSKREAYVPRVFRKASGTVQKRIAR